MQFSLTVLGSNSALPTSERHPSAQILRVSERIFLIDCGEGTQFQLRKYHINFTRINHIFISHLHGDHLFGLIGLISTLGLLNRKVDLHIYAHKELEELLTPHLNFFCSDMAFKVRFHHLNTQEKEVILVDKHITVESFPLSHRIPSCGFLFKEKPQLPNIVKEAIPKYQLSIQDIVRIKNGEPFCDANGQIVDRDELVVEPPAPRSFAYCSDTRFFRRIIDHIKGVSLLYHEATFTHELKDLAKKSQHTTALQAGIIAKEAEVQQLLIGHFSSRYRDVSVFEAEAQTVFPNTIAVHDGFTYEF